MTRILAIASLSLFGVAAFAAGNLLLSGVATAWVNYLILTANAGEEDADE